MTFANTLLAETHGTPFFPSFPFPFSSSHLLRASRSQNDSMRDAEQERLLFLSCRDRPSAHADPVLVETAKPRAYRELGRDLADWWSFLDGHVCWSVDRDVVDAVAREVAALAALAALAFPAFASGRTKCVQRLAVVVLGVHPNVLVADGRTARAMHEVDSSVRHLVDCDVDGGPRVDAAPTVANETILDIVTEEFSANSSGRRAAVAVVFSGGINGLVGFVHIVDGEREASGDGGAAAARSLE